MVYIEPFKAQHLEGAVDALLHVSVADLEYPPRSVPRGFDSYSKWLTGSSSLARWVAIVDGEVAGHVWVSKPHAYLLNYLESVGHVSNAFNGVSEIGKLYVDPRYSGKGIGKLLLQTSRAYSWDHEMEPALAVVTSSVTALHLYKKQGLKDLGSFMGVDGENRVMVDERLNFK